MPRKEDSCALLIGSSFVCLAFAQRIEIFGETPMSHQYDEKRQPAVRFAFVCRYCQGTPQAKSKDPAFAPIVVALSSKAMAEILGFTRLVESQLETDFGRRKLS